MKKKIEKVCVLLSCFLAGSMVWFGCGDLNKETTALSTECRITNEIEMPDNQENMADVQIIIDAINQTSKLPSFQITTDAAVSLKGKAIKGEYLFNSDIHVVQDILSGFMEMTSVTTSNMDSKVTKSWYKDGIFYTDDGENVEQITMSSEEVLATVGDIAILIEQDSDHIFNLEKKQQDNNMIYSFEIPDYMAERYLDQLIQETAESQPEIAGANPEIEKAVFTTTLDNNNYVVSQEIYIVGNIRKAIFKVPAEVKVISILTQTSENSLNIE